MKALIVQVERDILEHYDVLENEEVWIFPERKEINLTKLAEEWKNNKENFPKFYQYMEYNGGVLINFDEFTK